MKSKPKHVLLSYSESRPFASDHRDWYGPRRCSYNYTMDSRNGENKNQVVAGSRGDEEGGTSTSITSRSVAGARMIVVSLVLWVVISLASLSRMRPNLRFFDSPPMMKEEESVLQHGGVDINITVFIRGSEGDTKETMWYHSFFISDQLSLYGRYHHEYEHFDFGDDRLQIEARATQYCVLVGTAKSQVTDFQKEHAPHCYTIVSADEQCDVSETQGRFYYNHHAAAAARSNQSFIPLGPRLDFWAAYKAQQNSTTPLQARPIIPTSKRPYLFNAIFSQSTSPSRSILADYLASHKNLSSNSIINIAPKWTREMDPHTTIAPSKYAKILSRSQFTLSPNGHNPECFRLYEAAISGSIPIIALDEEYQHHPCPHALLPLAIDKSQQVEGEDNNDGLFLPFVVLRNNWTMLESTLDRLFYRNPDGSASSPQSVARRLDAFQSRLVKWYHAMMRRYVRALEDRIVEHAAAVHH